MKCHVCGGSLENVVTNMPFKHHHKSIVILRDLPVLQCAHCREYLIADSIFSRVETILNNVGASTEVEIVHYAA